MLAHRGEAFQAWQLYRRAAQHFARAKQWAECLAVYREACRFVPYEFEAWRLCSELQLRLGQEDAALRTLLDGRTRFGDSRTRAQAIALLSRARAIEPWDPDLVLDLARLYAQTDQADVALCAGKGRADIYVHGEKRRTVAEPDMLDALLETCAELAPPNHNG